MTGPEAEPFGTVPDAAAEAAAQADGPTAGAAPAVAGALPEPDPAAPAPLHVVRAPTGDADVDVLLDRLADADHLATDGHVEVYEDVHRGLRDALTALDAQPGPPVPLPSHSNSNRS
ncbi:hypothetical protein GCM10010515_17670 [Streptomyces fructofermentans]|uniref:Uncharacterized protein n=2 Tax=Streptomyces fructofermentans TaxID=152141 RepID=A0A918N8E0_9ACTN|nr:hypothetical protein GCM10010515_17670 [Streptomyces fructofermentans]